MLRACERSGSNERGLVVPVDVPAFRFMEFRRAVASSLSSPGALTLRPRNRAQYDMGLRREARLLALHGLSCGYFPEKDVRSWLRRGDSDELAAVTHRKDWADGRDEAQGVDGVEEWRLPAKVDSRIGLTRSPANSREHTVFEDLLYRWTNGLRDAERRDFESELLFGVDFDPWDPELLEGSLSSLVASADLAAIADGSDLPLEFPLRELDHREWDHYPQADRRFKKRDLRMDDFYGQVAALEPGTALVITPETLSVALDLMTDKLRLRLAQVSGSAADLADYEQHSEESLSILRRLSPRDESWIGISGGPATAWTVMLWRLAPTDRRSLGRIAEAIEALRANLANLTGIG